MQGHLQPGSTVSEGLCLEYAPSLQSVIPLSGTEEQTAHATICCFLYKDPSLLHSLDTCSLPMKTVSVLDLNRLRNIVKIKSSQNGEIILSFTIGPIGK